MSSFASIMTGTVALTGVLGITSTFFITCSACRKWAAVGSSSLNVYPLRIFRYTGMSRLGCAGTQHSKTQNERLRLR